MQDSDGNAENVLISSKVSSRTTPVSIFYPSAEAMYFPRRECSVLTMHGEALRVQTATCPEVYWGERGGWGFWNCTAEELSSQLMQCQVGDHVKIARCILLLFSHDQLPSRCKKRIGKLAKNCQVAKHFSTATASLRSNTRTLRFS